MSRRRRTRTRPAHGVPQQRAAYLNFMKAGLDDMKPKQAGQQQQGEQQQGTPNGTAEPSKPARAHKATYSSDKRKGGYLVRVEGPSAAKFAGRTVPVTRKSGEENAEELDGLVWSGVDEESGKPVALYTFKQKPRAKDEVEF